MAMYVTNELSFDMPEQLHDKSIHIFSVAEEGPSPFNLVISRSRVSPRETLSSLESRILAEIRRILTNFRLLRKTQMALDGVPALLLDYRWTNQGVPIHQRQVSFLRISPSGDQQMVQLTASITGHRESDWDGFFERLLASVRHSARCSALDHLEHGA